MVIEFITKEEVKGAGRKIAEKRTSLVPGARITNVSINMGQFTNEVGVPVCPECGRTKRSMTGAERVRLHRMRKG